MSSIRVDPDKQHNIDDLFNTDPLPLPPEVNVARFPHRGILADKDAEQKEDNRAEEAAARDKKSSDAQQGPPKKQPAIDKDNIAADQNGIIQPGHNADKSIGINADEKHKKHLVGLGHAPHYNGPSMMPILLTVIVCQLGIYTWQKKKPRSFFLATLCGLWLFPVMMSVKAGYYRMILIWCVFSCIFGILLNMSRQKPMNRKTPRLLYSWFYVLYKLTNWLSVLGYVLFLADFFGLGVFVFGAHPKAEREYRSKLMHMQQEAHLHAMHGDSQLDAVKQDMLHEQEELVEMSHGYHHIHFSDIAVYMLFYGLYYGVLARDTAQLCTDWISSALGFFNPSGFPRRRVPANICAVCNNPLVDHNIGLFDGDDGSAESSLPSDRDSATDRRMKLMKQRRRLEQKTQEAKEARKFPFNLCSFSNAKQDEEIEINCKHRFHGFCIRGWIMMGKRDVCPVCKEKVDLKGIFANPWQKQDRLWSQLLDGVRYLMVWNPVIALAANFVFAGMNSSKDKPA